MHVAVHAFEGLVLRHGPMVLDVCTKILIPTMRRTLSRRRSWRWPRGAVDPSAESVGSWLHGVAFRVARQPRSHALRRKAHERRIAEMNSRDLVLQPMADDCDFQVLHEEVERLPRTYREPVVLCYLEGLTLESAAAQSGCPVSTLGVRLMRARERLKARLTRRAFPERTACSSPVPAASVLPSSLVKSHGPRGGAGRGRRRVPRRPRCSPAAC